MRLILAAVSAINKIILLVLWEPILYSMYIERFACKFDDYTFKVF